MERDASGGRLPWEVTRDPSKVGGASVRLVTSKAERYIEDRGMVIDDRFNEAVWFYFIGSEIDAGNLAAVPGWNDVEWTRPKKMSVDAGRDSQASRQDIEMGIKNWSDELDERGGDFDDWLSRRKEQARQIMRACGKPDSEEIPLWMIYKPGGVNLTGDAQQETQL
jgi:capsid protein